MKTSFWCFRTSQPSAGWSIVICNCTCFLALSRCSLLLPAFYQFGLFLFVTYLFHSVTSANCLGTSGCRLDLMARNCPELFERILTAFYSGSSNSSIILKTAVDQPFPWLSSSGGSQQGRTPLIFGMALAISSFSEIIFVEDEFQRIGHLFVLGNSDGRRLMGNCRLVIGKESHSWPKS